MRSGWGTLTGVVAVVFAAEIRGLPLNNSTESVTTTPSDGRGLAYAESCQAQLWAYTDSSWANLHQSGFTSSVFYTGTATLLEEEPGTTASARVVTLCDGYPRVVGHPYSSLGPSYLSTTTWTNTNPTLVVSSPYGPSPTCSIGPKDCELLYSSWTSHYNAISSAEGTAVPLRNVPCTTSTPSVSYSTNAQGGKCDNCLVIGHQIRLLYWPIATVPGSGNLCNKSAETITLPVPSSGPRTYVTEGITITSPSVAVSIGGLSRVDGCGPTIASTIIPVPPSEVTSVRGARALFSHHPFNFTDLNYHCLNDPDEIFVSDEGRDDCYQQVPAAAYWDGEAIWAGLGGRQLPNATIWNNYQPQVLPPFTLSSAIQSIWGNNCYIHPDGVWDPPRALQQQTTIDLPFGYTTVTPTEVYTPAGPGPTPSGQSPTHVTETRPSESATALPDQHSGSGPSHGFSSENGWSWPTVIAPSTNTEGRTVVVVHSITLTVSAAATSISDQVISAASDCLVIGAQDVTSTIPFTSAAEALGSGQNWAWPSALAPSTNAAGRTVVVVHSVTLTVSAAGTSINGHYVSASSDCVVVGTDDAASTITFTSAIATPIAYRVGGVDFTLTSAEDGSAALVNGHSTIRLSTAVRTGSEQVLAAGTELYTVEPLSNGGFALQGAETTIQVGTSQARPGTITSSGGGSITPGRAQQDGASSTSPGSPTSGATSKLALNLRGLLSMAPWVIFSMFV